MSMMRKNYINRRRIHREKNFRISHFCIETIRKTIQAAKIWEQEKCHYDRKLTTIIYNDGKKKPLKNLSRNVRTCHMTLSVQKKSRIRNRIEIWLWREHWNERYYSVNLGFDALFREIYIWISTTNKCCIDIMYFKQKNSMKGAQCDEVHSYRWIKLNERCPPETCTTQ